MFFGNTLLTRVFLYAGRAILRFTACVNKKAGERRREIHFTLKFMIFESYGLVIYIVRRSLLSFIIMIFGSYGLVIYTVKWNLLFFVIMIFGSYSLVIYTVRRNLLFFAIMIFGSYSLMIDAIE